MIEDAWDDFHGKEVTPDWDETPEHWKPKVPKQYKVVTKKHKQKEPIEKTEIRENK